MYRIKNVKNNIGEKTITIDDLYSTFRKSGILAFEISATESWKGRENTPTFKTALKKWLQPIDPKNL